MAVPARARTRAAVVLALVVLALVAVTVVAVSGSAVAAPPPATAATDRIAIGDSVMLAARVPLQTRGFAVDVSVGRQFHDARAALRAYGDALPGEVVLHLGANGPVVLDECRRVVRLAGASRRVYLVTTAVPRLWQAGNNRVLRACDGSFDGDRVVLVDWHAASRGRPGWFERDRHHLRPGGARAYAQLIDAAVDSRTV